MRNVIINVKKSPFRCIPDNFYNLKMIIQINTFDEEDKSVRRSYLE